ncbi:hypothetical protein AAQ05_004048 [Salmonella enterica subsp. diarizonae]|nr:hypothetical protein [Salmonella enterica subsp. diarizonae]
MSEFIHPLRDDRPVLQTALREESLREGHPCCGQNEHTRHDGTACRPWNAGSFIAGMVKAAHPVRMLTATGFASARDGSPPGRRQPRWSVHDIPVAARGCARVCSETQRPGRSSRMKNGRKNQNSHHREPGIRHSSPGQQKK